jgi:ribosome-associated toxin RatA of RatAB toxin-antitoxin module
MRLSCRAARIPNRIFNMLLLVCSLWAWSSALFAAPPLPPTFELDVERVSGVQGGKVYQIASSGIVAATPAVVWRILTDYNHLADYVPDLKSARVVSRDGDKVIVEQLGTAHFLFFRRSVHLLVQVHEQAPNKIDINMIDGDMKVYRASWELIPLAGASGTRVVYNATIEPKFYVPAIVGESLVRNDIAKMIAAVLMRIDRQE